MVVEDKIEEAKKCFQGIKKSGKNNFQHFEYFETKDIFPRVREVCEKFNIRTNFEWDDRNYRICLVVTDKDDKSEYRANVPIAKVTANDPGKYMQDIGRIQTYAMRYLYIQVFEIAVPDEIDNKDQRAPKQKKQPTNTQKQHKQKQVEKQETPEVPTERVNEILDKAYATVTIDAGKEFNLGTALWTLKQLCENEDELQACKDALKLYTADKVKQ